LLLGLDRAFILMSESRGTHDHILLSQIRDSPNLEGQVPVFISPGTGWPSYTARHRVPFSSPPTTRRATAEVLDPASTRVLSTCSNCSAYNISARTAQKTPFPTVPVLLRVDSLPWEHACLRRRYSVTGLHATTMKDLQGRGRDLNKVLLRTR
jgi:hypothetical protein